MCHEPVPLLEKNPVFAAPPLLRSAASEQGFPFPFKVIVRGLVILSALCGIFNVAVLKPLLVGKNLTWNVPDAPGGKYNEVEPTIENWLALVPVIVTGPASRLRKLGRVPVLVTVTLKVVCDPTSRVPKLSVDEGDVDIATLAPGLLPSQNERPLLL